MSYKNPIIPGFAPDPSVVLSWTLIGNAINRLGQIDLAEATTHAFPLDTGETMIATAGLFAPTIRYHHGTFYIICTNCSSDSKDFDTQNFYITTQDIWSNSWSNPIFFDFKGIDPSIFFDEDDRAYIQGSWRLDRLKQPSCTIKQFEVDLKTGRPISEAKEIWEGFARYDSEGPHIYKKDGWYYLMIAEGGTFEHHMLSMARANIWGPYESYEKNPILTADGSNEYIQNTGHGELFQDAEGLWWAVVLGVRDNNGRSPLGRESFLTPVIWPVIGWPEIQHPKMLFERQINSSSASSNKQDPHVEHIYIRQPVMEDYQCSGDNDSFSIRTSSTDLSATRGTSSFLGRRQRALDCNISVDLVLEANKLWKTIKAGLTVYKDDFRHAEIFFDYNTSEICFSVTNKIKGRPRVTRQPSERADCISFRILSTIESYDFQYRIRGATAANWYSLGSIDAMEMTARDFTGTIFGIFANGNGDGEGILVSFESFEQEILK